MILAPFVSVIIPVYNDSKRLRLTLTALEQQTYGKERFEVIVVDNGSDDGCQSLISKFPNVHFALEERVGSYFARNRGISLAKGEIVALTDSDVIPAPHWIESGVKALSDHPDAALAGGKIGVYTRFPQRKTLVDQYELICGFDHKFCVERAGFSMTANLFTYKRVFDEVGPFSGNLKSGGDFEWACRARAKGLGLVYADDALVNHYSRRSFSRLGKRHVRLMGGYVQLLKENGEHWERIISQYRNYFSPIKQIRHYVFQRSGELSFKEKMIIVTVECYLFIVRSGERLRLKLRGKPKRV